MLPGSDGDHLGLLDSSKKPALLPVCRRARSLVARAKRGLGSQPVLKSDNAAMQIISIGPLDLRGHDLTDA